MDGSQLGRADVALIDRQWSEVRDLSNYWNALPQVTRRKAKYGWGSTGGECAFLVDRYMDRKRQYRRVLSFPCGQGQIERWLASQIRFEACDAFDISEGALAVARAEAARIGLNNVHYRAGDFNDPKLTEQYDLVIGAGLHHIEDLERCCATVRKHMASGAKFLMIEYVGPRWSQPTPRQLDAINAVIRLLPEKYRLKVDAWKAMGASSPEHGIAKLYAEWSGEGLVCHSAEHADKFWNSYTPMTKEQWLAHDPSEAVRSEDIIPVLKQTFNHVDVYDYQGSLLHFALYGIAANFSRDTPEDQAVMDMLFAVEDTLMAHDDVPMNWAVIAAYD